MGISIFTKDFFLISEFFFQYAQYKKNIAETYLTYIAFFMTPKARIKFLIKHLFLAHYIAFGKILFLIHTQSKIIGFKETED